MYLAIFNVLTANKFDYDIRKLAEAKTFPNESQLIQYIENSNMSVYTGLGHLVSSMSDFIR